MITTTTRSHFLIATILLSASAVSGQNFKVFEKYRQYLPSVSPDLTTADPIADDVDVTTSIDEDVIDDNDIFKRQGGNDRSLAYDNHHRNQIAILDPDHPLLPPTDTTLSTGLFHTCAITKRNGVDEATCGNRACGPVKCWGHDDSGQSSPPPGAMFTQISAGGYFTCGIKVEGDVVCWGEIDKALKSRNHLDESSQSRQVNSDERHKRRLDKSEYIDEIMRRKNKARDQYTQSLFSPHGAGQYIQVSSGMKHACAISRDLTVHCWGRNDFGESSPPNRKFVQISAGNSFTCGLESNGAVECWGKNNAGQLQSPKKYFQQISSSNLGNHACGLLVEDNTVHCWGDNMRGQTDTQDGTFLQVTPGMHTTCAVRSNSNNDIPVHCWGGRANELLDHIKRESKREDGKILHHQVSLGKDHACTISTQSHKNTTSSPSLQCWWLAGSDYNAHRVPVGLEIVM